MGLSEGVYVPRSHRGGRERGRELLRQTAPSGGDQTALIATAGGCART